MTEDPTTEQTVSTDEEQTATDEPPQRPTDGGDSTTDDGRTAVEYVEWAALAVLVLVALVATFRLYFSVSAAVDTFVTRRYRPLFMAGFNLVVLLGCGIGLSALVRRLT